MSTKISSRDIADEKNGESFADEDNAVVGMTYQEYKSKMNKEAEFGWKNTETLGSIPPSDYTITHINQNYDLLVS
jgi:hypothetical protein